MQRNATPKEYTSGTKLTIREHQHFVVIMTSEFKTAERNFWNDEFRAAAKAQSFGPDAL